MSNNEIMNIFASIFLNMKYLNNIIGLYKKHERLSITLWNDNKCTISPEIFIRDLMHKYNIPSQSIRFGISLHPCC